MPGNRIKTLKALQSRKSGTADRTVHPNSRRAKQLQRIELRTRKLQVQSKVQRSTEVKRIDRHLYFVHAVPDDKEVLSLAELHELLEDYIRRDDDEIATLAQERELRSWRKGEGKTKREIELEKQKVADLSEYRSGFLLPDLSLKENVFLCRQWIHPIGSSKDPRGSKGGDPSFLGRIRLIRISSTNKESVVVVQEGARAGEWEESTDRRQDGMDMADMDVEASEGK